MGWATGPTQLIGAVRAVRQHLSYVSGGPFQVAMVTALGLPDHYFTEFRNALQAQRDQLGSGLADLGLHVLPTEGTYFLSTDISSSVTPMAWSFVECSPPPLGWRQYHSKF